MTSPTPGSIQRFEIVDGDDLITLFVVTIPAPTPTESLPAPAIRHPATLNTLGIRRFDLCHP